MTQERWKRIQEVYYAAGDRLPRERSAFLAQACGTDAELREEVESLLQREESPAANLLDGSPYKRGTNFASGTRLGPYEIEVPIGAGGMGQVFRARDTRLNRTVAIKTVLAGFSDRFAREARAIAAMNHPNICTVHDVGPDYLVMELIEGPTLAEHIAKQPLPVDEALTLARQIAAALEAAHEKGIVHRDLKPANIKLAAGGTVKVLDFGLAKSRTEAASASEMRTITVDMTGPGMILGTPGYLSPEQARGQEADKRADIWAFGVVFYEMLTGSRCFDGNTASDAMAAVLTREPDLEGVPRQFRKLLRSCLEKDPKRRLRDIGDAWSLIEEVPVAAPHKSGKVWIGAAAALALMTAAALAGWWRAANSGDRPLTRLSLDLGADAEGGSDAVLTLSPDGRRIVFARRADGKTQLATRLLEQAQSTLLPGTEGGREPFFSPDSQWIAFHAHGALSKTSIEGGAPLALAGIGDANTGGTWGAGGNIAMALTHASPLSLIPASGGPVRLLSKLASGEVTHRWPQFLPDGSVLFTESDTASGMENANIAVNDNRSGAHKIVLRGGYHGRYVSPGYLLYIHQGALFAVRFDASRAEVHGSPVPLAEDVAADSLSGDGHFNFSTAPQGAGTLVYLAGQSMQQQWAVTLADSSGQARPLIAPGAYYNPAFSPDGRRLAMTVGSNGTDIFVSDVARGTMTRLTSDGRSDAPVWTPDGSRIALSSKRAPPGLWWMRSDGSADPELLIASDHQVVPWSFSPDGRRLLYFEIAPDSAYDLWILPIDVSNPAHPKAGKPEPFLRTQFNEASPSFSPDGRWVTYFSNESGPNEVYVRPASGEPGKFQVSNGGGMFPAWAPNGHQLFFEGPDSRIQVVDYVAKGASFEAGTPRQWSSRRLQNVFKGNFAVAPDGKIAIFEAPDAGKTAPRVSVLLNFIDELKRKLP